MFTLQVPPEDWPAAAPVRIARSLPIAASPEELFGVLADIEHWSTWFAGMRRVRIDGAASGFGALRTVWVGGSHVQERFTVWEEGRRLRFPIVSCSLPGLRSMVEDWQIEPRGAESTLHITLGVAGAGPLRATPWLVRQIVARSTRGAAGIAGVFAPTGGG